MTRTSLHPAGWMAAIVLMPVVLVALVVAAIPRYSADQALKDDWGIAVPDGLRVVEHHHENSFADAELSTRFTVFAVEEEAKLTGTFFDPQQMSAADLTSDQVLLVAGITKQFQPKHYLRVPGPGIRKVERVTTAGVVLCLLDESASVFYVYESRTGY
ncbi:MAG: hypothetical protein IPJ61_09745 [Tessaracoccus sp.]|uniref:hypothetical protein n=1 Tax=Tessaracoccus sp. TaxID=1971211 RepID=UPI001EC11D14|nr:hypothetical protein [Tessaracoccus sp.]MBK7821343.1 hypothetical protein [Tessaracoccus sp.]